MHHLSSSFFADADASRDEAAYVLFGVPYDATASWRPGTRSGPKAIREVSYNFETWIQDAGVDLTHVPVHDAGDLETGCLPDRMTGEVRKFVAGIVEEGKVPVMLGGEHSITPGAVEAVAPEVYVVLDAHLDLREEYGGTPYSHACAARRVYEAGFHEIFIIGARSGTKEEYEFASRIRLYTAWDIREMGMAAVIGEVLGVVGDRTVYLSVDADAIDCCLTPGLGTPEPFGLSPLEVRDLVRAVAPQVAGFDYNEVCPVDAGQTAAVAARIVRDFIAFHWRAKHH